MHSRLNFLGEISIRDVMEIVSKNGFSPNGSWFSYSRSRQ